MPEFSRLRGGKGNNAELCSKTRGEGEGKDGAGVCLTDLESEALKSFDGVGAGKLERRKNAATSVVIRRGQEPMWRRRVGALVQVGDKKEWRRG